MNNGFWKHIGENAGQIQKIAAQMHDIGKYNKEFQDRIRERKRNMDDVFVPRIIKGGKRKQTHGKRDMDMSERAARFAHKFGAWEYATFATQMHDIGKYNSAFQKWIRW